MDAQYSDDMQIVQSMAGQDVLVIGDIMLDRFVYGTVDRISPESPVPVLSVKRETKMLGAAGNTLSNLHHLGVKGAVLSVIGEDLEGEEISACLKNWGVDAQGLVRTSDRPTIVKTRYLAGHQQLLRTDYEHIKPVSQETEKTLIARAKAVIPKMKAVIVSDYGKGVLSANFLSIIIEAARKAKVPVLVDPKGKDYSIYRGADFVTPNKKELSEATGGMSVDNDDEVVSAARHLIEVSGVKAVVATRSQEGMSVIDAHNVTQIRSAAEIEVFDVSGAGDTVIATIAAALASGADIVKAAALANIAGSIVVAKVGTAPIRSKDLIEALRTRDLQNDINDHKGKHARTDRVRQAPLLDWQNAREEVLRWKARGLKVGFTNGCFDIIHFGHVSYLNEARNKCDRLIVGLNSDSSVRVLKGPERPIHDEGSRAAVLSALGFVDMVVHFGAKQQGDDNTACALLEMLQPDIYFKGGDYTIDQIPEAPTVHRNGGVVDVMPVYEGHSTTNSIKKMRV